MTKLDRENHYWKEKFILRLPTSFTKKLDKELDAYITEEFLISHY